MDDVVIADALCHNPYFNRWFSAIGKQGDMNEIKRGHNPYFNRWFSAIKIRNRLQNNIFKSQSLF